MKHRFCAFALAITTASLPFCAPTFAQAANGPIYIRVLGRAPVLGHLQSAAQLRQAMHAHIGLFTQAAALIGLTQVETDTLIRDIDENHLRYVTLPRHLQWTTWSANGVAHALYNVIIPPNTRGWEIDLRHGRFVKEVFIPQACGNISVDPVVLRPKPTPPPMPVPTPIPTPKPTPTPVPIPTATPLPPPPPQTRVVERRPSIFPFILGGIALFFLGHSTGTTTTTIFREIPPTPPPCF